MSDGGREGGQKRGERIRILNDIRRFWDGSVEWIDWKLLSVGGDVDAFGGRLSACCVQEAGETISGARGVGRAGCVGTYEQLWKHARIAQTRQGGADLACQ